MSESLKDLLWTIRQHPAYQEFLNEVEPPPSPEYKKWESIEEFGVKSIYRRGMRDQHNRFKVFLTEQRASQETNSEQEQL